MKFNGLEVELTKSKKYFVHRGINEIVYFDLDGVHIPLASATCEECGDYIQSNRCGDYVTCSCGHTAVDTDRWSPRIHRTLTT